tara:strand:- start:1304 stop:1483 length:180 start_codon:yes stop_codon:yes gene_type:complete
MINIYKDELETIKQCEFIRNHSKLTTNAKIVRVAVKAYHDEIKSKAREALLNRLEELER